MHVATIIFFFKKFIVLATVTTNIFIKYDSFNVEPILVF